MMKSKAWVRKGIIIHWAVSSAHRTWSSSNKKKKVDKSVRISTKPSITLKNVNFGTASILEKGHCIIVRESQFEIQSTIVLTSIEKTDKISNKITSSINQVEPKKNPLHSEF